MAGEIKPIVQWNRDYINAHPGSDLAVCKTLLHPNDPDMFVDTCCEITAMAILWKLGFTRVQPNDDVASFRDAERLSPTFMVVFDEGEHILLTHDGFVYQSYYKHYTVRAVPITEDIRACFDHPCSDWASVVHAGFYASTIQFWFASGQ